MRAKKIALHESVDSSMSFAVLGTAEKFLKNRHVRKCWEFCRDHRLKAYLVLLDAETSSKKDGKIKLPSRVYPSLDAVPDKIDVVVACLMPRHIPDIIAESARAEAHTVWFQENNWTPEFQEQAEAKGLAVVRGCMIKHRPYKGLSKFLRPCYWHGRHSVKAAPKYRL